MPFQPSSTPPRRKWQFSLRVALLLVLTLSILLAIASQFPRQSAFTTSMALLLLVPLATAALLQAPLVRARKITEDASAGRWQKIVALLVWPIRWLGLWQPDEAPALLAGLATAIICSCVLVGLWPVLREVGAVLSILSLQPIDSYTYTWHDASR